MLRTTALNAHGPGGATRLVGSVRIILSSSSRSRPAWLQCISALKTPTQNPGLWRSLGSKQYQMNSHNCKLKRHVYQVTRCGGLMITTLDAIFNLWTHDAQSSLMLPVIASAGPLLTQLVPLLAALVASLRSNYI